MGFGAGHTQDMINRIKQNRAQRPSNREKFKGKNREGIYSNSDSNKKPSNLKKISPEKLAKVKNQIREQNIKERKKERVVNIISLLSVLVIITIIIVWLSIN